MIGSIMIAPMLQIKTANKLLHRSHVSWRVDIITRLLPPITRLLEVLGPLKAIYSGSLKNRSRWVIPAALLLSVLYD